MDQPQPSFRTSAGAPQAAPARAPDDQSPPNMRSGLVSRVLCWSIIAIVVGFVLWSNTGKTATTAAVIPSNATLPIVGRYAVGVHAMVKGAQADPVVMIVEQLAQMARSPADKLRVAIISKEIEPPDRADRRLQAVAGSNPPPEVSEDLKLLDVIYRDGPDKLSPAQQKLLTDREGWFAKVALSFGLPDTQPARAEMLREAQRTSAVLATAAIVAIIALLAGFVLMVLAIVLAAVGMIRVAYRPSRPDSVLLEAFTVYLVGFILLSFLLHSVLRVSGLGWSLALTIMLPVAMGWPVLRGWSWQETRTSLGWHTGRGIAIEIGSGLAGYIAALPILGVMMAIALFLTRLAGASPSHPIISYVNQGPWQVALLYFIACIWAPVFEETMFRGALFSHLRSRHGWWISAPVVGFIFAAIHPQGWTLIPALGGIGAVLCGLREWRGSILAPMAAHALNNFTVMTMLVLAMG